MGLVDFIVMVILFILLFIGAYFLWLNLPTESVEFEEFNLNLSFNLPQNSSQFYPNMRYTDKEITYNLSQSCSPKKKADFIRATQFLEGKTVLRFKESPSPEIIVSCSNIAPEPEEEGHFVAGEGGPATIINASKYAIILIGKIALYRAETCDTPQIAIHELLHALGFNHNNNSQSIMYPYTNCEQTLDKNIIEEINSLYEHPSLPDLIIETLTANKSGRYLNFETTIANYGLREITDFKLDLSIENKLVKSFEIAELNIGAKRHLTVQNLAISRQAEKITFTLSTSKPEISKDNNIVEIKLQET